MSFLITAECYSVWSCNETVWAYPVHPRACFDLGRIWIQTMALRRSDRSPPRAVAWYSTTPLWTPTPSLWAPSRAVHHPTCRLTSWHCAGWSFAIVRGTWVRSGFFFFSDVGKSSFFFSLCLSFQFCCQFLIVMNISRNKDNMCKCEE